MHFDHNDPTDAQILFNMRVAEGYRQRDLAHHRYRQRSVEEVARLVAEQMVTRAAGDFPDVFKGRDVRPLVSLIAAWIARGGE